MKLLDFIMIALLIGLLAIMFATGKAEAVSPPAEIPTTNQEQHLKDALRQLILDSLVGKERAA